MKSNNPFEAHGIDHLSPSKINLWVADPALFVGTYLCGMKGSFGVGAFRGTAVEYALEKKLNNNKYPPKAMDEFLYGKFDEECMEHNVSIDDERTQKERSALELYYNVASEAYEDFGTPTHYQQKIYFQHEDLPIPFLGYIDFMYENTIRDLKTVGARPSKFSEAHQRQLAVYSHAYPDKEMWCDYVTKREAVSFKLQNPKEKFQEVIRICFGLQKFLSISNDAFELASMLHPNYDDWRWSEDLKQQSTKIWSNE